MRNDKGFTLIEVLVVALISAIIAGALIYVLNSSRRASRIADLDSQAQQNARVAIDYITRDLRSAGYNVDIALGQAGIVHAGPWDVVFNANIEPEPDDPINPGSPSAIDIGAAPSTVPPSGTTLYSPAATYGTGAETVRFTLDSNNDGDVDADDSGDEDIETSTANPNDYAVQKQVYGYDGATNGGASEAIALLRGPVAYPDGDLPHPLFTYWYDDDEDTATPDALWGDTDGSGQIDQGEIAGLAAVTAANRHKINRIGIHVIGTTRAPDLRHTENEGYRETVMTSEVGVRNIPYRAAYIRGTVYSDVNDNGTLDPGENGLAGAIMRLNTGATKTTASDGIYTFRVDSGNFTVTETDPVGYTSTTPNSVPVTAVKGTIVQVNFGDKALAGYGTIAGTVVLDEDGSGTLEPGEPGVTNVEVHLNTPGASDTTDDTGDYLFSVPVNPYTVTMSVPGGYQAVGPTSVDTTIAAAGDTVVVDFGLAVYVATGTIAGMVFLDTDRDGVIDIGESGIPDATIRVNTGDSTVTDGQGEYTLTLAPGVYDVTEADPAGYVSTTVNDVTGVPVVEDSTSVVNFGDILESTLSFEVITLGQTQRALCIASGDLKEKEAGGAKNDPEIILGTKYVSGVSNLSVWRNNWVNASTPNSAIFDQNPWYSRSNGSEDIYSVGMGDVNADGTNDVATGMTATTGRTLIWRTQTAGNNAGILPTNPTSSFVAQGPPDVYALEVRNLDSDSDRDIAIGTRYAAYSGRLEIWFNNGSGTFTHDNANDVYPPAGSLPFIGEVRSLAVGNVHGSAALDMVLGTATGLNTGKIEVLRDRGSANGSYDYHTTLIASGEVNAVALRDMLEDDDGDVDIIAGTKTGVAAGRLEIWHNDGEGHFGIYDEVLGRYVPSDTVTVSGEILCLAVEKFDRDVYPDIAVGMRQAGSYVGAVQVFPCYGFVPSSYGWTSESIGNIGEVITITVNDFNKDTRYDFAVGTRTTASNGRVVVFFNTVQ
jgi:prepilin-type N-terminal cleavage/methylation domain-containing protein